MNINPVRECTTLLTLRACSIYQDGPFPSSSGLYPWLASIKGSKGIMKVARKLQENNGMGAHERSKFWLPKKKRKWFRPSPAKSGPGLPRGTRCKRRLLYVITGPCLHPLAFFTTSQTLYTWNMAEPSSTTPLINSVGRAFQGRPLLWRSGALIGAWTLYFRLPRSFD